MKRKNRKNYTKQFKIDAAKLVLEEGLSGSEVGRNLGVGNGTVQRWVREYGNKQSEAFTGNGHLSPEQEKIKKLEAEVKRLKMEREILKKATAFFAKESD